MAVRSLNLLEKHAGKIFLGVAVVISATLVLHYVHGNPVRIESGGQTLTVDEAARQLKDHDQRLEEKIRPVKYGPDGKVLDPSIVIPDVITPAKGLDEFDPRARSEISRQVLANVGTPLQAVGASGPPPTEPLKLPLNLLLALPQPKVIVEQSPAGDSYATVCATLAAEIYQSFVDNLQQQAKGKRISIPDNLPLVFYRVRLQRRLVDVNDQPIGKEEDVPEYKDPDMDKTITQREKDVPFPGLDNTAKLGEFIAKWTGQGQDAIVSWLVKFQDQITHPKLPDKTPPRVDGYVRPEGPVAPPGGNPGEAGPPSGMPPASGPPVGVWGPADGGQPPPAPAQVVASATIYGLDTTVKPASRYQYRISYELLNPLLCRHILKDDEGNYMPAMPAVAWSPWSRTVQTPRDMYFWLLSEENNEPQFEVRRKVKGKWMVQKFPARIGQQVGQEKDGVDYRTGMTVVDIRRDVRMLVRRPESDGKVQIQMLGENKAPGDVEVVLRDASGGLQVRSMNRDAKEAKEQR